MPNKFTIGDKVLIKRKADRLSKNILDTLRLDNPRTITAMFYDNKTEHTRYYLGTNLRGELDLSSIPFRANQLIKWHKIKWGNSRGRKKTKRRYTRLSERHKGFTNNLRTKLNPINNF